jgi:hypothetical protein
MLFVAEHESGFGTSRHFAAAQQFGRFRSEADIEPLTEPDFCKRCFAPILRRAA